MQLLDYVFYQSEMWQTKIRIEYSWLENNFRQLSKSTRNILHVLCLTSVDICCIYNAKLAPGNLSFDYEWLSLQYNFIHFKSKTSNVS